MEMDYANPDRNAGSDFGGVTDYMIDYRWHDESRAGKEYRIRGGIFNTLSMMNRGQDVTVAYLGGSITHQDSWRPATTRWLQSISRGAVREVTIGLSGTCADLAVCRIDREILIHQPDLIFIEYAVNGGAAKDMEGMLHKIWRKLPRTDVIFVYTATTAQYQNDYSKGRIPCFAAIYEQVADHYGVPSVFFGYQAYDLYDQGKLTLGAAQPEPGKILYTTDQVHMTADGGMLAASAIARSILPQLRDLPEDYRIKGHILPESTLDPLPWVDADTSDDWDKMKFAGPWLDCSLDDRGEFKNFPYTGAYLKDFHKIFPKLTGTRAGGSSVTVRFRGRNIGVFEAGGQFSGALRVIVDGKELENRIMLFNHFDSKLRHQYYFVPELEEGEHVVTFILDENMPDKSVLQSRFPEDKLYEKNEFYLGKILFTGQLLPMES